MTTNDYQWQPMTNNDNQWLVWLPITTFWLYSYYFWLHSGYFSGYTFWLYSGYIFAAFWLHFDLKPIKLRILVSSWFHIKSSGKEKGGYKSLFVESEPRISFCFSTNIPSPGQHLALSAISSLIRRVCALRSRIGCPQNLERKSFGINIDFHFLSNK